jgi:hypothetical protein
MHLLDCLPLNWRAKGPENQQQHCQRASDFEHRIHEVIVVGDV